MEKLISVIIPCYNAEKCLAIPLNSLMEQSYKNLEIIIVNDGSKDGTAAIADEYAEKYPTIVKAVHQENGGHGEAVNAGLRNATGLYYKVVDSDDWVNEEAYLAILKKLAELVKSGEMVDMFISNYVYEKEGKKRKKVMQYRTAFPTDQVFTWDDVKFLHVGQYILMHSVIYRTQMLKDCGLELPKHTFYVDNVYVYHPLPYVKKLYYMDVNFYRYYIGREGQSVQEQIMIGRIDQQIRVNKILIDDCDVWKIKNKKLRNYMLSYLEIMMAVSSILAIKSKQPENLAKKKELWQYLKAKDVRAYKRIRRSIMGNTMNLPGEGGRKISVTAYKIAQMVVGFN
jgi:glycosyltransferase involved in cell wall biosynthesis